MTCQGRLFLLSGEEFGRTKQGQRDTHNAPITLNRLDWQRAWDHRDLVGLLPGPDGAAQAAARPVRQERRGRPAAAAGRNSRPPLCDGAAGQYRQPMGAAVPCIQCLGTGIYLYTGGGEDWQCLADGETTFGWQQPQTAPTFTAAPGTALILGKPSQL